MTPEVTAIATTQESEKFNYIQRVGRLLAASGYFGDVKDQAQAVVKVLAGDELGIPPIAAMMGIYIVKGKVQLGSNLIASRIRAHGYDYRVTQLDAQKCSLEFLGRPDVNGKRALLGESSFSIADAQQAGISSETYKKYPRNMLFARAMSNGAKWFVPDVFAGIPVYAEGELSDAAEDRQSVDDRVAQSSAPSFNDGQHSQMFNAPVEAETKIPTTFAEKLSVYTREKERVGKSAYYEVLGSYGFEHANEVVKRPLQERQAIYNALRALPDDDPDTAQEPEEAQ